MNLKKLIGVLVVACGAVPVLAQEFPLESEIRFQVWNGSAWASSTVTDPGVPVQWRVVVSYTGPRTDLVGLGLITYQPTFSNVDNTGSGASLDHIGTLRSDRVLTATEAASTGSIVLGGRVTYGNTPTTPALHNVLTVFRHSGGSSHAPPGNHMRIAGSYVTDWPPYPSLPHPGGPMSTHLLNLINRGVTSDQVSQALRPATWAAGTRNLVVFRGEFVPSVDAMTTPRNVTLSTFIGSFRRAGGSTSTDNRRYMSWQTHATDSGSYRTSIAIVPATITVRTTRMTIAEPSARETILKNSESNVHGGTIAWATAGVGGLCMLRRRRA